MITPERLISGTVVLIIGIIFLLVNLQLIPGLSLNDVLKLWPLLLIFLGIRMLIGNRPLSLWLAFSIVLIMVFITVAAVFLISGTAFSSIKSLLS